MLMCDTYQKLTNEGGGATFKWMKCHLIDVWSRVLQKKKKDQRVKTHH
jgi:hypothetical protein